MRRLAIVATILLAACYSDSDKARFSNDEADRIECAQKGGVQTRGNVCLKVDSVIPMTGPRINPSPYKP